MTPDRCIERACLVKTVLGRWPSSRMHALVLSIPAVLALRCCARGYSLRGMAARASQQADKRVWVIVCGHAVAMGFG